MQKAFDVLSNLAYVVAGIVMIDYSDVFAGDLAGFLTIVLGVFSGIFHYRPTRFTHGLDWTGIFLSFTAIAYAGFRPFAPVIAHTALVVLTSVLGILTLFPDLTGHKTRRTFLGVLGIGAIIGALVHGAFIPTLIGVALLVAGLYIRELTLGWAHGVWHLLTAAGMTTLLIQIVQ